MWAVTRLRKAMFGWLLSAGHTLINWAPKVYPDGLLEDEVDWAAEAATWAEETRSLTDASLVVPVVETDRDPVSPTNFWLLADGRIRAQTTNGVTWTTPLRWSE